MADSDIIVERLKTAATALEREVTASFALFEPLARREMGNTNYNIIVDRCADVRLALASFTSAHRDPNSNP